MYFYFFTVKNTVVYKLSNPAGASPHGDDPAGYADLRNQTRHQIIRKIRQVRNPAFYAPNFYPGAPQFLYDMTFKITRRQRSHQPCKVIQQHIVHTFQYSKHLCQPFTVFVRFKIGTVYPALIGFIHSCQRQCFGGVGVSFTGDAKLPSCCSLLRYTSVDGGYFLFTPVPFVIF